MDGGGVRVDVDAVIGEGERVNINIFLRLCLPLDFVCVCLSVPFSKQNVGTYTYALFSVSSVFAFPPLLLVCVFFPLIARTDLTVASVAGV